MSAPQPDIQAGGDRSPVRRPFPDCKCPGFTLLEVLVAIAILGIALTVVMQLFSANVRALSVSDGYVTAVVKANAMMRDIVEGEDISEKSWSENTPDGYRLDVAIAETLSERTQNLPVRLLEIRLTLSWRQGSQPKSFTLTTMKLVERKV